MELLRKYGQQFKFRMGLVESGSSDFKESPTLASGDVMIMKDGGSLATISSLPAVIVGTNSIGIEVTVSTTESQAAQIDVFFRDQSEEKEWKDTQWKILTFGNASAQIPFDLGSSNPDVNVKQINSVTNAAVSLEKALEIDGDSGIIRSNVIQLDGSSLSAHGIGFSGGAVYFDAENGYSGTSFPVGTVGKPTNDIDNAVIIAAANKLKKIIVLSCNGSESFSAGANGFLFVGQASENQILYLNSKNIQHCRFEKLRIEGETTGKYNEYYDCIIDSSYGLKLGENSILKKCHMLLSETGTSFTVEDEQHIVDQYFHDSSDLRGDNLSNGDLVELSDCHGDMDIALLTTTANIDIYGFRGKITIGSSCDNGTINIFGGSVKVTDNSTGSCTVNILPANSFDEILTNLSTVDSVVDSNAAALSTIDTVVDAIKDKTDNLPADTSSELDAIDAALTTVDTVVDAIKTKTDNLPANTSSELDAIDAALTTIDTVVDAVKTKTDNLPANTSNELDAIDAALITIDSNVDSIKTKTDNLPTNTSSELDAIDSALTTIDTVVDAVKSKTDNLPDNTSDELDAIDAALTTVQADLDNPDQYKASVDSVTVGALSASAIQAIDAELSTQHGDGAWDGTGSATLDKQNEILTNLATVDSVADSIKTKTDNLPANTSDELDAIDAALTTIDSNVDNIKIKTDNLPNNTSDELDAIDAALTTVQADLDNTDQYKASVDSVTVGAMSAAAVQAIDTELTSSHGAGTWGSGATDVATLLKFKKNKREIKLISGNYYEVVYDDDSVTEIARMKLEKFGGGTIGALAGTTTPSIRSKSSV